VDEQTRRNTIELARTLAGQGDVDGAVRAYQRAGSSDDAAQLLIGARRFAEAAKLLMNAIGVAAKDIPSLDASRRTLVHKAAVCFAQAGDVQQGVELFLALGDRMRAAQLLERSGDKLGAARLRSAGSLRELNERKDAAMRLEAAGKHDAAVALYVEAGQLQPAARIAHAQGKPAEAARYYLEAGLPYEAAICFHEASDAPKALDALSRVERTHAQYRVAALQAVQLAHRLGTFDFRLDQFLGDFVRSGPKSAREEDAFYLLGRLYEDNDFKEAARDTYEALARARPGYRDAAERALALGGGLDPPLPELPPLPDLAPPPSRTPARTSMLTSAASAGPKPPPPASSQPARAAPNATVSGQTVFASSPSGATPATTASSSPTNVSAARVGLGAVVAGRFRLDALLGQGGMAAVYRATDLELGEEIALKLLTLDGADAQAVARFKQEVSLTRRLTHPNIVRIHDLGEHFGQRFITMELVAGNSLGALIAGKPLELRRALRFLIEASAGLAAAHANGIVHRDVKPDNLLVTHDDHIKVMDFGIAKARAASGLTVAGFVAGTPSYISPEQIAGFTSVTHLSDLYSLGIAAYEMFTGTLPFAHEDLMPLLLMHLQSPAPLMSTRNPSLPPALDALIARVLEKKPEDRVSGCVEFGSTLEGILRDS